MPSIVPMAKTLFICDDYVGYEDGRVDLYGLFLTIDVESSFPYVHDRFCLFAQLNNGLGKVSIFVDIRDASTEELIWTSEVREVEFPNRKIIVHYALTIEGCLFPRPGTYTIHLFCNNAWLCDSQMLVQ